MESCSRSKVRAARDGWNTDDSFSSPKAAPENERKSAGRISARFVAPDGEKARERTQGAPLEILLGQRLLGAFVLPIDRQHPPTLSIMEKLDAVDPAHEGLEIARITA